MRRILQNHFFLPLFSLFVQLLGLLSLRWHIVHIFHPERLASPTAGISTSYAIMGVTGLLGLTTAFAGMLRFFRSATLKVALLGSFLLCTPSLFLSAAYLYALLLFGGIM